VTQITSGLDETEKLKLAALPLRSGQNISLSHNAGDEGRILPTYTALSPP
jgi:hypothetical protein